MQEFTIFFRYNDKEQRASVLRKFQAHNKTEYNVRPEDSFIVKTFGHQINILKRAKRYFTLNHISKDYKEFFDALVAAIRLYERPELSL